jgi:hypothetical protein
MLSAFSSGGHPGIPVCGTFVGVIRFVGLVGTSGGNYSRVSFVRRPW